MFVNTISYVNMTYNSWINNLGLQSDVWPLTKCYSFIGHLILGMFIEVWIFS